jgi:hypothetical protein
MPQKWLRFVVFVWIAELHPYRRGIRQQPRLGCRNGDVDL